MLPKKQVLKFILFQLHKQRTIIVVEGTPHTLTITLFPTPRSLIILCRRYITKRTYINHYLLWLERHPKTYLLFSLNPKIPHFNPPTKTAKLIFPFEPIISQISFSLFALTLKHQLPLNTTPLLNKIFPV